MSSADDSESDDINQTDDDDEAAQSPDTTAKVIREGSDEGSSRNSSVERRSVSRNSRSPSSRSISASSMSRSRSRSSSRSNSPEQSTRRLYIDSDNEQDEEGQDQDRRVVDQIQDSDEDVRRDDRDEVRAGNDFDLMMQEKKEANRRYRRKKDIDVINDNDDAIAKLIADMRIAAKEDRDLNERGRPATKKMSLLRHVMHNITKVELQLAFIEANLLSVMTDWLAPMPDKSLPHIMIRNDFLRVLHHLKIEDPSRLKESGIGKAIMYLYRHPRETKDNKLIAGHIIHNWARPIFHKEDNFANLSKEDRREKDAATAARKAGSKRKVDEEEAKRPGDPGWIGRARVPQVESNEYVSRPAWQTNEDLSRTKKKGITLLEKHKRKFAERKRNAKTNSLTKISIEGARMDLG